ncbi:MAG: PhnD/SsuA/transferrin family substrate-binding protein, partial [Burkholderiaceae bacterium]
MSVKAVATLVGALPMYHCHPTAVEQLWAVLTRRLTSAGLAGVPLQPQWPTNYHAHWLQPGLLLSQACGYPLVTVLGEKVQVVGAFHYDVPGCTGVFQRSQVVVRADDSSADMEDLRGRRVAFNGTESQSGYNSLRALVAPLARNGQFFGARLQTGAHVESVKAVRDGKADVASIDCVSLAGFRRYAPDVVQDVRVLTETAAYPGLPLITAAGTDKPTLAVLRLVMAQLTHDPAAA